MFYSFQNICRMTAKESRKLRNIQQNPHDCTVVVKSVTYGRTRHCNKVNKIWFLQFFIKGFLSHFHPTKYRVARNLYSIPIHHKINHDAIRNRTYTVHVNRDVTKSLKLYKI